MTSPSTPAPDVMSVVQAVLAQRGALEGALLPVLHGVQDALGFVPPDAVPVIARALNLSRAEVHGVITYYHHFRQAPPPRCVVQVCRAESCQALGAEALLAQARDRLGCAGEATASADGRHGVEAVYCLGLCALSPAVKVGERLHARMTPEKLDAVLAQEIAP